MHPYVLFRTRLRLFLRVSRTGALLSGAPDELLAALEQAEALLVSCEGKRDPWARADAIEAAERALDRYRSWLATSCART